LDFYRCEKFAVHPVSFHHLEAPTIHRINRGTSVGINEFDSLVGTVVVVTGDYAWIKTNAQNIRNLVKKFSWHIHGTYPHQISWIHDSTFLKIEDEYLNIRLFSPSPINITRYNPVPLCSSTTIPIGGFVNPG